MEDQLLAELKDGLSQSDRLLRMLFPGNIGIDDRDPAQLMQLAALLAGQINYYNADNIIDGDWQDFFSSDINILTLIISGWDLSAHSKAYGSLLAEIWHSADEDAFRDNSRELINTVFKLADSLGHLLQKVDTTPMPAHIAAKMAGIMENVVAIRLQLESFSPLFSPVIASEPGPAFPVDPHAPASASPSSTTRPASPAGRQEQLLQLLPGLHKAFSDLLIQCTRLQEVSDYYRKNYDWTDQQYTPHLGLFITFLHLYGYLREEINQLTKEHLDYYYRNILAIATRTEVPDKVHLLFTPNINAGLVRLNAGEEMLAEIPGREDPLKYRLITDTTVTPVKVAALKTLFISERTVFLDDDPDHSLLKNAQVYQGDYPGATADLLMKGNTQVPWPLFGEDQDELARLQRSMNDTNIGLLLASPVFYLTEAQRKIQLTFYFEPSSFKRLGDYITRFAAASLKTEQAVQNEILTRAFDIDFTAADGWSPAERYTVRMPENNTLEVLIELGPAAKALEVYKPGIHGPDHGTTFPAFRLLINNDAPHNAFSFLRSLLIQRIHLRSQVQHFRQVKMQNSIGNLAIDSAFQPFGPQPVVGSYLDIKNSNIFNRYTTDLAVRLEWMDLPKEPGGFATWFAGYNTGVTDDSFRIGIGALRNGTVQPPVAQQQTFPLYTRSPDDGVNGPSSTTWIRGIDIKKLEFSNLPLLAQEEEESNGFFRNGAIRLELLSPPEAFGHALFPKIFPEVAMHNARLWTRKLPLPNQPYTPRAKSASVNYTLEHAEAFKDTRESGNTAGGLEIIHQYPFGYKKIYPGDDARFISLLPDFDTGGHLHLGLSDATSGEELSLLFQLDEKNFHHTLHDSGSITWSYLVDNDWVTMSAGSILTDTTHGFINTGIVRLKLPELISLEHTILPAGLFWIRASVSVTTDMKSKVIAILSQAGLAERVPDKEHPFSDSTFVLPAGSIKNFIRKVQGLEQVWQPFLSFGGSSAEKDEAYYTRISERLRHKKRPLTSLDIEQLVLEKFPSIAVVKCFGTSHQRQSVYPGVDIQVILIPKEGADGNVYIDQPKVNLSTLFAVKNYLAGFASPFINIEIGNPVYEKIKIACRIRLTDQLAKDAGSGYYLQQLHEDIRQWLCPWIYAPDSAVRIGTRIYIPELLTYIKKRPYITEVRGFSVVHFFKVKDAVTGELKGAMIDSAVHPIEFIQGSVPEAVLIPSDHHLIRLLDNDDYIAPDPKGIGDLYIGNELLISYPRQTQQEGYDEEPVSRESPDEYFNLTFVNPVK
ncbi:hypothetical protein Q4E93_15930 [Flavitalea sp. BT771]|uniref:hypothetical protein n=1 Tax=Flavitalea sp. BT771 TaxID=3063329 RepID=UPI0026E131A0|nr:hypothetical protein [Flavitalea sp. BT771]MDO6432092.1 hypothetical protein [Flavitalea sp. BT771]MDV6221001.1 hypothetical protein [Flavitalea sp. BT771]